MALGCSDDSATSDLELTAADGGGVVIDPACPLPCDLPFICTNDGPTQRCSAEYLGSPGCEGVPPDSPLGVRTTADNVPLHFVVGACVPVTYSSEVAGFAEAIGRAVDAWRSASCSQLCFSEPQLSDGLLSIERAERRVHFRLAQIDAPQGNAAVQVFHELSFGRVFGAEVWLGRELPPAFGAGDILQLLLEAAGIEARFVSVGEAPPILDPTEVDAICAMYGEPPVLRCGRSGALT